MGSDLKSSVEIVGVAWKKSAYYDQAENWTHLFWGEGPFLQAFGKLDLRTTLELACGHGRHAEQIVDRAGSLTLMDIHAENLDACRQRLATKSNVAYVLNNGYDFKPVSASSTTAIFCYDAMVHFSPDLVESYLHDASRILKRGGMGLFHHSNYDADPAVHYSHNPHCRNKMTVARFRSLALAAGLEVVQSQVLAWGGAADIDGLTLVRKPG